MILTCKGNFGIPNGFMDDFIEPVADRENKKVWPDSEKDGRWVLVKGEKYKCEFPKTIKENDKEVPFVIPDWFENADTKRKISKD